VRRTTRTRQTRRALAATILSMLLPSCSGDATSPTSPTCTSAALTVYPATVAVGGTVPRTAHGTCPGETITWTSDDAALATVTTGGQVTGVRPGIATIRASAGSVTTSATITVVDLVFVDMAVGGRHTCARNQDGVWYCWGDNAVAALGRLTNPELCPAQRTECSTTPRAGIDSPVFARVALGAGGHSCGMTAEGVPWCWGNNGDGALSAATDVCEVFGSGSVACSRTPVGVPETGADQQSRRLSSVSSDCRERIHREPGKSRGQYAHLAFAGIVARRFIDIQRPRSKARDPGMTVATDGARIAPRRPWERESRDEREFSARRRCLTGLVRMRK